MLTEDLEINSIIEKVLGRGPFRKNTQSPEKIDRKYINMENKDLSFSNYELQAENIELRKKEKKLEKVLKGKVAEYRQQKSYDSQIEEVKNRLHDVLASNQVLELSLSKLRISYAKNISNSQVSYSEECCCSRRKTETSKIKSTSRYLKSKHNATDTSRNDRQKSITDRTDQTISLNFKSASNLYGNPKPFSQDNFLKPILEESVLIYENKQVQIDDLEYLSEEQQRVKSKREYVQKLRGIMLKQEKVLEQYRRLEREKKMVGRIANRNNLKNESNKSINKCSSVGSIVKTQKNSSLTKKEEKKKRVIEHRLKY